PAKASGLRLLTRFSGLRSRIRFLLRGSRAPSVRGLRDGDYFDSRLRLVSGGREFARLDRRLSSGGRDRTDIRRGVCIPSVIAAGQILPRDHAALLLLFGLGAEDEVRNVLRDARLLRARLAREVVLRPDPRRADDVRRDGDDDVALTARLPRRREEAPEDGHHPHIRD